MEEERVCGTVDLKLIPKVGCVEVRNVFVSPEARRRGVAEGMMWTACDWAKDQGAKSMELEVDTGNVGAYKLYVKKLRMLPAGFGSDLTMKVSEVTGMSLRVALRKLL